MAHRPLLGALRLFLVYSCATLLVCSSRRSNVVHFLTGAEPLAHPEPSNGRRRIHALAHWERSAGRIRGIIQEKYQVHRYSVDLTVKSISQLDPVGQVDFGGGEYRAAGQIRIASSRLRPEDRYEWWDLERGCYAVAYNETLELADDEMALLEPDTRLLRAGGTHTLTFFRGQSRARRRPADGRRLAPANQAERAHLMSALVHTGRWHRENRADASRNAPSTAKPTTNPVSNAPQKTPANAASAQPSASTGAPQAFRLANARRCHPERSRGTCFSEGTPEAARFSYIYDIRMSVRANLQPFSTRWPKSPRSRAAKMPAAPSVTAAVRLDRLPKSRYIRKLIVLLSLGAAFEFYDLFFTAYIAPALYSSGIFTPTTKGFLGIDGFASLVASLFAGLFIGTLFFSRISDRFGRRSMFSFSCCGIRSAP